MFHDHVGVDTRGDVRVSARFPLILTSPTIAPSAMVKLETVSGPVFEVPCTSRAYWGEDVPIPTFDVATIFTALGTAFVKSK